MQVWGKSVILCLVQKMSWPAKWFVHYKDFRCMVSGDTSYNICMVSGALMWCLSRSIQAERQRDLGNMLSCMRFLLLVLRSFQDHDVLVFILALEYCPDCVEVVALVELWRSPKRLMRLSARRLPLKATDVIIHLPHMIRHITSRQLPTILS